jgi:hypothetical protein
MITAIATSAPAVRTSAKVIHNGSRREPERSAGAFKLLSVAEMLALPPLTWRVQGVLPAEGLAAMFGPSGAGKSFLVLDLCAAIAEGHEWFGLRVTKAPVAYLALEGSAGVPQRIAAWQVARKRSFPGVQFVVNASLELPDDASLDALADSLTSVGVRGGLVVIDTLNRAAPGLDENSSREMGKVIAGLARLRDRLGGVVLAVHHSGKNASAGMRGHSSLIAALDAAIAVEGDKRGRTWSTARAKGGKSKDGAEMDAQSFRLDSVDLVSGVSSCVVNSAPSAAKPARPKEPQGGNQLVVIKALRDLLKNVAIDRPEDAPESMPTGARWARSAVAIEHAGACLADIQKRMALTLAPVRSEGRASP